MKRKSKLFLIGLLSLLVFTSVEGQELVKLPMDTAVRYGKLDNGMTYYIRHNATPKNQADFYIAQKVGSIQEEDSQQGLAHFLEHMAFNGTTHFPRRKTMLNYLEKNGVKFGYNVNAYTAFDETVYNITNVPMDREGLLDSCLLILHDWSGYISLEDAEIDKERQIIKEEWRTTTGANIRTMNKIFPILFKGSKYADRMPIGKMEVVENFKYQEIKDYYKKWYRPDLQGIIIVGDIDADAVEAKVKKLFSTIPMPENAAERIYYTVDDNKEPIVTIATDPELTSTSISLAFKEDMLSKEIRQSEEKVYRDILDGFISRILNSRYQELAKKKDAPFLGASVYKGNYLVSKTKLAWNVGAGCKEGEIEKALEAMIQETERAQRFGFLDSEIERAKINLVQGYENSYNNRDKRRNNQFTSEYVNGFIEDTPIPGIEKEYELIKKIVPSINAQVLNAYLKTINLSDKMSIIVMGPEKENLEYPTADKLVSLIAEVKKQELTPYQEEVSDEPLVSNLPAKGKIVKKEGSIFDSKVWTLSNGVKVVLKNTDFKNDEINMNSFSYGGKSLFDDNEMINAGLISSMSLGGLGNFDNISLGKKLAGKSVNVSASVSGITQGVYMYSTKRDVETALQLVYLTYTSPRKDEEAFAAYMERIKNSLRNQESLPNTALADSLTYAMYGANPRFKRMKMEDLSSINYDRVLEMYKECFQKGAPSVFVFVGTIDEEVLAPLVEQYLATLPVGDVNRKYIDRSVRVNRGEKLVHFTQTMETPKTTVMNIHSADLEYNQANNMKLSILKQVLDLVYTRTIREEQGGTYGVGTQIGMSRLPEGETQLMIQYTTDSAKVENLNKIANNELEKIAKEGPQLDDFNKTIEYMKKSFNESIKTNGYWLSALYTYNLHGDDNYSTYLDTLNAITTEDIKEVAGKILKDNNYIEVIMYPK